MKSNHTPPRSLRVPDDVWQAAMRTAQLRGETLSSALVAFLEDYGREELQAAHALATLERLAQARPGSDPLREAVAGVREAYATVHPVHTPTDDKG